MSFFVGFWLKSLAIALETKALNFIGVRPERIPLNRHRTIIPLWERVPEIEKETLLTPSSVLISDVKINENSSVGFATALRGDLAPIRVGLRTTIGDRTTITTYEQPPFTYQNYPDILIGSDVTIGPNCTLNGCQIGDYCVIEMGSVLLPGSVMEPSSSLAAGSLLGSDQTVPSGELWGGNPARKIRDLTEEEKDKLPEFSKHIRKTAQIQSEAFEWEGEGDIIPEHIFRSVDIEKVL